MEVLNQWTLFISAFTSATVLPGSSEAVFGILIAGGEPLLPVLFVATFGNWIGGMTSYGLGRLGRWTWLSKMGVGETDVLRIQIRIQRWGALAGLLAWAPVIGDVVMVALGYFRVSLWKVSLSTVVGRFFRYLIIAYLTFAMQ